MNPVMPLLPVAPAFPVLPWLPMTPTGKTCFCGGMIFRNFFWAEPMPGARRITANAKAAAPALGSAWLAFNMIVPPLGARLFPKPARSTNGRRPHPFLALSTKVLSGGLGPSACPAVAPRAYA